MKLFRNILLSTTLISICSLGSAMADTDGTEIQVSHDTAVDVSKAKISLYVAGDSISATGPVTNKGDLNPISDSRKSLLNFSNYSLKVGDYIDEAPFFVFKEGKTPYNNIGLDKLAWTKVVMEASISVDDDGFYYIYPLEEYIPEYISKDGKVNPISATWIGKGGELGTSKHSRQSFLDDNFRKESIDNFQQVPWADNGYVKPSFKIMVNDELVFDYKGNDVNVPASVEEDNYIRQSVVPVKLDAGQHSIIIEFYTYHASDKVSHKQGRYIDNFDGFNIHARKIETKQDKFLVDIFNDREQTKAVMVTDEATVASDAIILDTPVESGWVIDTELGLEDFSEVTFNNFTLASNEQHTLRFAFTPSEAGDYIISHDLDLLMADGQGFIDTPKDVAENCVIWGSYMDEWDETYKMGYQAANIENGSVEKNVQLIKNMPSKKAYLNNRQAWGDGYGLVYGGVHTLLPITIGEELVDTQISVTLNYNCNIQKWAHVDGKLVWDENLLDYRPDILMKAPSSSGFTSIMK